MGTKIYASQDYVNEAIVDKISTPMSANIGQTLVVKAVDENGKPTEWEAVDPMVLADESTGKKYKLSIVDAKLTMTEVGTE